MSKRIFQRNTQQRKVILEELRKLASHPTAVGLYEIVRRRLPKISLGTVYRNLLLLAEMGMIRKLDFGGPEARFDGNVNRHDHVRCVCCGRVEDIHGTPLELPQAAYDDCHGYEVLGHHVELLGVCDQCRPQQPREKRCSPGGPPG